MRAREIRVICLAGLLLCLGGCMFRGTDELFFLPRTSETYQNLQAKVQEVMGSATGISPVSGSNTQTLQLVDLDRDGTQEAVAFFRDNSTEWPLKIAVFKQAENGDYALCAQIDGAGTDIESIEYKNMVEGRELEILVSWQISPTIHTLVSYSIREQQASELMRSGYTRYLATDLNGDERAELLLVHMDSANPSGNRVELFMGVGTAMEFHSVAPLSENLRSLQLWEAATLIDKLPCFMVTSECTDNTYITDIFHLGDTGLRNITLGKANRISSATLRHHTGVLPTDINADGITEIPITKSIHSYPSNNSGNGGATENLWEIVWTQFSQTGAATAVLSTYHNNSDRWYLELPTHWAGQITLSRPESSAVGERAVVFSHWNGNPALPPEPFLTIYRLSGNNRGSHATQDKRFTLWADPETIYVAEFTQDGWDCGLSKEDLLARFHTT